MTTLSPVRRLATFLVVVHGRRPLERELRQHPQRWRQDQRRAAQAAFPPNPNATEREDLS